MLLKIELLIYFENTQSCFAYISATKYRSEAILYSKQMTGYLSAQEKQTLIIGTKLTPNHQLYLILFCFFT